ncbi:hypothetical protein BG004_005986, partial [Podila humilis]
MSNNKINFGYAERQRGEKFIVPTPTCTSSIQLHSDPLQDCMDTHLNGPLDLHPECFVDQVNIHLQSSPFFMEYTKITKYLSWLHDELEKTNRKEEKCAQQIREWYAGQVTNHCQQQYPAHPGFSQHDHQQQQQRQQQQQQQQSPQQQQQQQQQQQLQHHHAHLQHYQPQPSLHIKGLHSHQRIEPNHWAGSEIFEGLYTELGLVSSEQPTIPPQTELAQQSQTRTYDSQSNFALVVNAIAPHMLVKGHELEQPWSSSNINHSNNNNSSSSNSSSSNLNNENNDNDSSGLRAQVPVLWAPERPHQTHEYTYPMHFDSILSTSSTLPTLHNALRQHSPTMTNSALPPSVPTLHHSSTLLSPPSSSPSSPSLSLSPTHLRSNQSCIVSMSSLSSSSPSSSSSRSPQDFSCSPASSQSPQTPPSSKVRSTLTSKSKSKSTKRKTKTEASDRSHMAPYPSPQSPPMDTMDSRESTSSSPSTSRLGSRGSNSSSGSGTKSTTLMKRHICEIDNCGKLFTRASNLRTHTATHTNEKKFECDFPGCKSKFARVHDMKRHQRNHTNDLPYKCKICDDQKFVRNDPLWRHYQHAHNGDPRVPERKRKMKAEDVVEPFLNSDQEKEEEDRKMQYQQAAATAVLSGGNVNSEDDEGEEEEDEEEDIDAEADDI